MESSIKRLRYAINKSQIIKPRGRLHALLTEANVVGLITEEEFNLLEKDLDRLLKGENFSKQQIKEGRTYTS